MQDILSNLPEGDKKRMEESFIDYSLRGFYKQLQEKLTAVVNNPQCRKRGEIVYKLNLICRLENEIQELIDE